MEPKRITVVFEPARKPGWWVVHSPELPGVLTQGNGFVDAIEMFKDAYEAMREDVESGRGAAEKGGEAGWATSADTP